MDNKPSDERLIEEIRGFREDMRRSVLNALWVFAGSVILVCVVFGPPLPKIRIDKDHVAIAAFGVAAVLGIYLVTLLFNAIYNAQVRKRHQRETFQILSGRTAGAGRREP